MRQVIYTILENTPLTASVYRMRLRGDTSAIVAPGQFINIRLDGLYLRRPISVCDWDGHGLVIIYKAVGKGTEALSNMVPGEALDCLSGLGNGYDLTCAGEKPVLIGGGVGVPPLYGLAKRLVAQGRAVTVCLGFNIASEVFYEDAFQALGCEVRVSTVDGSHGAKGFVTEILPDNPSYYYACGPEPMLKAVFKALPCSGQLSFEARMGCGFGACMGCTCETVTGYKRICKDGPVLRKEELTWNA
ncbi:MAG: dihydroorotate dehydrogenase electron transfer subunit [Clostridia bacterium]|nr:dihydroorotate dehydrogenase electron transfer subunit [Clostridia bacterium]